MRHRSGSNGVVVDIFGGPLLPDSVSTAGSAVPWSIKLGWVKVNKSVPDRGRHHQSY